MMELENAAKTHLSRRGGALISAVLIVATLAATAAAVFGISMMRSSEARRTAQQTRALYLAEAGLSEALMVIAINEREDLVVPATIGTEEFPMELRNGDYWCEITALGGEAYSVVSRGRAGSDLRALEARIAPLGTSIYDHAIFAGNSSGDLDYTLKLSGTGSEADSVNGDIYSGNDIEILADATVSGDVDAAGAVSGMKGTEGVDLPIPDIPGMNYDINHDVDVAAIFAAEESYASNALGGSAFQVPEESPAHIFRKNPDDRTSETSGTVKDDFFLEDPYEAVRNYTASYNGRQGHTVTLAGVDGEPGSDGNEVVYYVDGNMWVHNKPWGRMRFNRGSDPVRITFVVKGNIYFSDDVTVIDQDTDGVAFIAIKDDAVADSGNVYLGDPRYGTVERLEAFLYAENDFIDYNLDEDGSKEVTLFGNMTAGNHVSIERDFEKSDGSTVHSRLTVNFDDRISTGQLELPGIPLATDNGVEGFAVVFWSEVAF